MYCNVIMDIRLLFITFYFPVNTFCLKIQTTLGSTEKLCFTNYYFDNGSCIACPAGFYGLNCAERCPISYYGRMCLRKCTDCTWLECDTVTGCNEDVELLRSTKKANTISKTTPTDRTKLSTTRSSYTSEEGREGNTDNEQKKMEEDSYDVQGTTTRIDRFETGPTSSVARIFNLYPNIKVSTNLSSQEGENVYIQCEIDSDMRLTDITWFFYSWRSMRHITDSELNTILRDEEPTELLLNTSKYSGGTTRNPSLFIKDISRTDEGIYTCTANYAFGKENASVYLEVLTGYSESFEKCKREYDFYMKMGLIGSAALIFILSMCLGIIIRHRRYAKRKFDESMRIGYSNLSNFYASIDDEQFTSSSHAMTESTHTESHNQGRRAGTHSSSNETFEGKTEETEVKRLMDQIYEKLINSEIGKTYGYSDLKAIIEKELDSIKE